MPLEMLGCAGLAALLAAGLAVAAAQRRPSPSLPLFGLGAALWLLAAGTSAVAAGQGMPVALSTWPWWAASGLLALGGAASLVWDLSHAGHVDGSARAEVTGDERTRSVG